MKTYYALFILLILPVRIFSTDLQDSKKKLIDQTIILKIREIADRTKMLSKAVSKNAQPIAKLIDKLSNQVRYQSKTIMYNDKESRDAVFKILDDFLKIAKEDRYSRGPPQISEMRSELKLVQEEVNILRMELNRIWRTNFYDIMCKTPHVVCVSFSHKMSRVLSENSECCIRRKGVVIDGPVIDNYKEEISTSSVDTTCSVSDLDLKTSEVPPIDESELSTEDKFYIWKRNSPLLYDMLLLHKLDWPSLTVSLTDLPSASCIKNSTLIHRLTIGTHTSHQETDYIILGELRTPLYKPKHYVEEFENHSDFSIKYKNSCPVAIPNFESKAKLVHPGEANRIIHMPNNQFYLATQTNYGDVLVFDYSKHPSIPLDSVSHPQYVLKHHTKEGYGLSWNSQEKESSSQHVSLLASSSFDGSICLWDVSKKSQRRYSDSNNKISTLSYVLEPFVVVQTDYVLNDIKFLEEYSPVAGVVTDDGRIQIYDFRNPSVNSSTLEGCLSHPNGSNLQLNCLCFNPFMNSLVLTGSDSGSVHLWDLRYLTEPIKQFDVHKESITQLSFSYFNAGVFGSSSTDGTVSIFDLANENPPEDSQYPKELKFIHMGHQGPVNDFCWCKNIRYGNMLVSVGQDNSLQCWRPLHI